MHIINENHKNASSAASAVAGILLYDGMWIAATAANSNNKSVADGYDVSKRDHLWKNRKWEKKENSSNLYKNKLV